MSGLLAVLLAMASPAEDALATERAFAAAAQRDGQWTAFRAFADESAILFTPRATDAQEALEGIPDPAIAVHWWPARSWISCDGTVAVHTGPWVRAHQGRVGYFVTIWRRQPDGSWRWIFDDGADLDEPMPAGDDVTIRQASCAASPSRMPRIGLRAGGYVPFERGASQDRTLEWRWQREVDGSRRLVVRLSNGARMEEVFVHTVEAPEE